MYVENCDFLIFLILELHIPLRYLPLLSSRWGKTECKSGSGYSFKLGYHYYWVLFCLPLLQVSSPAQHSGSLQVQAVTECLESNKPSNPELHGWIGVLGESVPILGRAVLDWAHSFPQFEAPCCDTTCWGSRKERSACCCPQAQLCAQHQQCCLRGRDLPHSQAWWCPFLRVPVPPTAFCASPHPRAASQPRLGDWFFQQQKSRGKLKCFDWWIFH